MLLALATCAPSASAVGRCGTHPWCDTSLSPAQRAQLLLNAMSQYDRIGVLTGQAASDVGMPAISFTDGAVGAGGAGSGTSAATAMPAGIALAANFDPATASSYGSVVGAEVKHRGFDGDFGPTVNIMRTPLGGRTFEAYGEDPFLSAQTGVGWIKGFQAQGVMADVKHFAANNQEGQFGVGPLFGAQGGRQFVNVHASQRTLHEIELAPFEAAIRQGNSATVMCSYNQIGGVYSCANPWLLTSTLRGEWGFDGFVVSDFLACHEVDQDLKAGMNLDIGNSCYSIPETYAAVESGAVSQSTIDQRVFETLKTLFAFGFFDHPTWPKDITQDDRPGDAKVAEQVAEGGTVLLRNQGALPIDPSKVHSIAVIGRPANSYLFGGGSSQVTPYQTTNALQGITARAQQAGLKVTYDDGSVPQNAESAAAGADLAIVVAADSETEGTDKKCMSLTPQCSLAQATPGGTNPAASQAAFGDQDSLISTVAKANPHTVVVLETGAPVLTPWRSQVAGLLEAWYPGQEGGTAIARVLFGDADPGGRLPATFPQQESDLPTAPGGAAQYPGTTDPSQSCKFDSQSAPCPWYQEYYSEGLKVGYRWYDAAGITPAFPFGFGLSYTSFSFSPASVTPTASGGATVSFTVTNTGARPGVAVPEVYVSFPSALGEPPQRLAGFQKVALAPGASTTVTIPLDSRAFSYWNEATSGWTEAPGCYTVRVGASSRNELPAQTIPIGGAIC